MKKTTLFIPLLTVYLCGCMKGADTKGCVLQAGGTTAPADGLVEYYVTHSQRAYLKSVSYYTSDGVVKTDTAQLPFTIQMPVSKGSLIHLSAEGTAMEGNIVAGYRFTSTHDTLQGSDTCYH